MELLLLSRRLSFQDIKSPSRPAAGAGGIDQGRPRPRPSSRLAEQPPCALPRIGPALDRDGRTVLVGDERSQTAQLLKN